MKTNLSQIQGLENRFEKNDRHALLKAQELALKSSDADLAFLADLMVKFLDRDYSAVIEVVSSRLASLSPSSSNTNKFKDTDTKACALQFALMSCEMVFDLSKRQKLMSMWTVVECDAATEYSSYLKSFSYALTAFYDSQLTQSSILFSRSLESAIRCQDIRGQARIWFHQSLIARDQGQTDRSSDYTSRAIKLATAAGLDRTLARARLAECKLNQRIQLFSYLQSRTLSEFRRTYLQLRKERRFNRESRSKDSHYQFLALYCVLSNKTKTYEMILNGTRDLVIKHLILTNKVKLAGLNSAEKSELELVCLSINRLQTGLEVRSSEDVVVSGRQLSEVKEKDVKNFVKLLLSQKEFSASKEQICQSIWGIDYDPVIHDGKLYKLIHKARKTLDSPNLIVNSYGGYQLNAKLIQITQVG